MKFAEEKQYDSTTKQSLHCFLWIGHISVLKAKSHLVFIKKKKHLIVLKREWKNILGKRTKDNHLFISKH